MPRLLGSLAKMGGKLLFVSCLGLVTVPRSHGQGEDLDQYKFRFTGSWWYSQPSGKFEGRANEGTFDLRRDFDFGSYSTFTGTVDWRFKRKHHLLLGMSPVSYSNRKILTRTITFQDETYDVGTAVTSDITSFSFSPGYQWDFIRRDRGYLALATQVYLLNTSAKLTGAVSVNGQTQVGRASGSFFAPLPVLGPHARWYPFDSRRFNLQGYLNGMYFFGYGDFYSARALAGFGLSRHWGAIAGYQMGTRLSIHGGDNNIGIRLTQKGPVVGIESSW